ncbi:MAG: EF-hand domain-containing protein [Paludisphaera borealis]|uniref:EF-hand domain-containing protein n=1 Tax=Paludisphaera borealis TaxID=1387353 RepID=UPI00283EF8E0|nr:EF-hand domain-containing protein [Paludisphaera borealis]MDR3621737.1 EF-hand domain-containing protein [Paludisphaera borealis]
MIRSGAFRLLSATAPAFLAAILGSAPSCSVADDRPDPTAASDREGPQDLVFLADGRPVFIRLKFDTGSRGFRSAWLDAVKELHGYLDRDGDGTLTRQEADRGGLPAMVRAATGNNAALPTADLDADPRDGKVSLDELAAVLRPALGPFRVQVDRLAVEKTDALFNQLDRDKDGRLSQAELRSAVASLRRFDLDDDEQISPDELDPFRNPTAALFEVDDTRRGRFTAVPPVIELSAEDPSVRPVRMLLRRYDTGAGEGAVGGDNRLSNGEFGIDPRDFEAADADADSTLDSEELRRYLAKAAPDVELTVKLPDDGKTPASIEVGSSGSKAVPPGVRVQRISSSDIEVAVGEVNLEFHADAGARGDEAAKSYYQNLFRAADVDKNMYLEKSEVKDQAPLSSLFDLLDRDGDGKVDLKEVDAFSERQSRVARSQLVLSAADQGRAIFAIVDLNRDRKLGEREVRSAVDRVSSWDRNGDGQVSADEIPHHFQMTIGRGRVDPFRANLAIGHHVAAPVAKLTASGPEWFRRMDRNHDGDVSRREFLGPRADFDRLDVDRDGLLNPDEAAAAKP